MSELPYGDDAALRYFMMGKSLAQIAEIMNTSVDTIRALPAHEMLELVGALWLGRTGAPKRILWSIVPLRDEFHAALPARRRAERLQTEIDAS